MSHWSTCRKKEYMRHCCPEFDWLSHFIKHADLFSPAVCQFQVWEKNSAVCYSGNSDGIHIDPGLLSILDGVLRSILCCWGGPHFQLCGCVCVRYSIQKFSDMFFYNTKLLCKVTCILNVFYLFIIFQGAEILSPYVRTVYTTAGVNLFFAGGYMLLPFFGFFIRDWRMLLLGLSLPGFFFVPLWW